MTPDQFGTLLAIIGLLFLSAFFSGSETALTATSRSRMHKLRDDEEDPVTSRRAGNVSTLISDRERLIGAILLGNNLVNILASALATGLFLTWFGDVGVAYATLVMTTLVLIFAEVMPKTYAITKSDHMALRVAAPIRAVVFLFSPVVWTVQWLVRRVLWGMGVRLDMSVPVLSAREELRGAINLRRAEGRMIKVESDMLSGILDLVDVDVGDIMVHRRNIVMIDAGLPGPDIVEQVVASPHTRLPMWKGDQENIVGILHSKDILRVIKDGKDPAEIDFEAIAADPWFVPETTALIEQLEAFRIRRAHMALVVDEYGALMGLVTLEDILEEIVGEIDDEYDPRPSGISLQNDGSVVVDGLVNIRDLNRQFDWNLSDNDANTIAGLVIFEARTIPSQGQKFHFFGFEFQILRRKRNQITLLRIVPPAAPEEEDEQAADK